jgi:hypothetical protein
MLARNLLLLLLGVSTLYAQTLPEAPTTHKHGPRLEAYLVAADSALRIGDAITTHRFLTDPCKCMIELDPMAPHSGSWASEAAFQGLNAAVVIGGARLLRHYHHNKLARALLIEDISQEGYWVVNNSLLLEAHGTR